MQPKVKKARAAREAANEAAKDFIDTLSARECAEIVQVAAITWQTWEGSMRSTEIPFATLEYFKLMTGTHPRWVLRERECN